MQEVPLMEFVTGSHYSACYAVKTAALLHSLSVQNLKSHLNMCKKWLILFLNVRMKNFIELFVNKCAMNFHELVESYVQLHRTTV